MTAGVEAGVFAGQSSATMNEPTARKTAAPRKQQLEGAQHTTRVRLVPRAGAGIKENAFDEASQIEYCFKNVNTPHVGAASVDGMLSGLDLSRRNLGRPKLLAAAVNFPIHLPLAAIDIYARLSRSILSMNAPNYLPGSSR